MKIIGILVLILFISFSSSRLLTGTSCSLNYIYLPETPSTKDQSNSNNIDASSGTKGALRSDTSKEVTKPATVKSYHSQVSPHPMVVYTVRKGNDSWRVSVLDENNAKNYKSKGAIFLKEATGDKWFTHDSIDKKEADFKVGLARCQTLNKELKEGKAFRVKEYEAKIVKESDLFEKVSEVEKEKTKKEKEELSKQKTSDKKEETKVAQKKEEIKVVQKKEEKASDKKAVVTKVIAEKEKKIIQTPAVTVVNKEDKKEEKPQSLAKANSPVETKIPPNVRFMQKQDGMDSFDDDGDLEAFTGGNKGPSTVEKVKPKEEKKVLIEKETEKSHKDEEDDDSLLAGDSSDKDSAKDSDSDEESLYSSLDEDSDSQDSEDDDQKENNEENKSDNDDENNELTDDENAIQIKEDFEPLMDNEEEHEQEEMEEELRHDLNPYGAESNPDLL